MREQDGTEESVIDVTIPIQALVNDSKLIIPGGRAKVGHTRVLDVQLIWDSLIYWDSGIRVLAKRKCYECVIYSKIGYIKSHWTILRRYELLSRVGFAI